MALRWDRFSEKHDYSTSHHRQQLAHMRHIGVSPCGSFLCPSSRLHEYDHRYHSRPHRTGFPEAQVQPISMRIGVSITTGVGVQAIVGVLSDRKRVCRLLA
ncbi:hypothetical protein OG21DRAFT_1518325 [Imleria badia]|nr:hypothetical protein OG21DRAFT_1518325 [Imleria badia]